MIICYFELWVIGRFHMVLPNFIVLFFWISFEINVIPCAFRPSWFFSNCLMISSDSFFSNSGSYPFKNIFVVFGTAVLISYPSFSIFPLFVKNFFLLSESLNKILISLVSYLDIILYILIFY